MSVVVWVVGAIVAWLVLSVVCALLVGRMIAQRDRQIPVGGPLAEPDDEDLGVKESEVNL